MLEELKERVCKANIQLRDNGLVMYTWGNVSAIDRQSGHIVIKPSGVSYDELTPDKMVVVNMDGRVVEGELNPSSDTLTHIVMYQAYEEIGSIIKTCSRYATIWAQAGLDIVAYGTMHADYFYGDIPCTMPLREEQITEDYEKNTGYQIVDTLARRNIGCMEVQACLVAQNGPVVWGTTIEKALENAIVLEELAHMAVFNTNFQFGLTRINEALLDKHYLRKHGENAYYGQTYGSVQALDPNANKDVPEEGEDLQITPSSHTVKLKNISEIGEVAPPVIHRPPKKEEEVFNFDTSGNGEDISSAPSAPAAPAQPAQAQPAQPAAQRPIYGTPAQPSQPVQPAQPAAQRPIYGTPARPSQPVQPAQPAAQRPIYGTPAQPSQPVQTQRIEIPTELPDLPEIPDLPPAEPLDFTF